MRELEADLVHLLVPGTGLSYEDARGWIPTDRYRFRFLVEGPEEATVEAIPKEFDLARNRAYSKLLIRIDPRVRVVTCVVFYDRAGKLLKTYEADEFVELADRWYPTQVSTDHRLKGQNARIRYRYRMLAENPPDSLFAPQIESSHFLPRLERYLEDGGYSGEYPMAR